MSDAILQSINHHELVFVGEKGTRTYGFGFQPTPFEMKNYARRDDRYVVQLIKGVCQVYDLATLRFDSNFRPPDWTVDDPVFSHEHPDAAIMWAVMNL